MLFKIIWKASQPSCLITFTTQNDYEYTLLNSFSQLPIFVVFSSHHNIGYIQQAAWKNRKN